MLSSLQSSGDNLLKGSFQLFLGTMIGTIGNYLFQFFMSRHLSIADFGAMNSLLSLMVIASVPAVSILLVSTKYVSNFRAQEEFEKITLFRKKIFSKLIRFGAIILILLLFVSPLVSSFFKINSYTPVMILFTILFFSFLVPLNFGTIQGLQKFPGLGICVSLMGFLRLIFGILLISMGFRLNGAMMAILFSYFCVFIISFHFSRGLPIGDPQADDLGIGSRKILTYSWTAVLTSLGIIVLTNVDLILVKHYFPGDQAGIYAAFAVLGRAVFYFPGVIVMAMFPMTAESYALGKNPSNILKKAFGITVILAGSGLIVLIAIPDMMLFWLFGKTFSEGASLLRFFSFAMFFMALNNVLCSFLLAIERKRFIFVLLMGCVVEILLISFFHESLVTILFIMNVVSFLICASLIYQTRRVEFKKIFVGPTGVSPLVDLRGNPGSQ